MWSCDECRMLPTYSRVCVHVRPKWQGANQMQQWLHCRHGRQSLQAQYIHSTHKWHNSTNHCGMNVIHTIVGCLPANVFVVHRRHISATLPSQADTEWACAVCTYLNQTTAMTCEMCGKPKPPAPGTPDAPTPAAPVCLVC